MLADKAGDTLGTKLDVCYLQNQIEGLPTFIFFAANAKGNDAEVNLSMREGDHSSLRVNTFSRDLRHPRRQR